MKPLMSHKDYLFICWRCILLQVERNREALILALKHLRKALKSITTAITIIARALKAPIQCKNYRAHYFGAKNQDISYNPKHLLAYSPCF